MTPPRGFRVEEIGDRLYFLREDFPKALPIPLPEAPGPGIEHLPGGRGGVLRVHAGETPIVIRAYRHGGLTGPLLGSIYMGSGRGLAEIDALLRLEEKGVPAPRPVVLEWRPLVAGAAWGPGRLRLGTVEIPGAVSLFDFLARTRAEPAARRRAALEAAGETIRKMHDAGVEHADLHVGNLLVLPSGEVAVVDLDRARLHPGPVPPAGRLRNLLRLRRSARKRASDMLLTPAGRYRLYRAAMPPGLVSDEELLRALSADDRRTGLHALLWD